MSSIITPDNNRFAYRAKLASISKEFDQIAFGEVARFVQMYMLHSAMSQCHFLFLFSMDPWFDDSQTLSAVFFSTQLWFCSLVITRFSYFIIQRATPWR